jgi:hypothetical protein
VSYYPQVPLFFQPVQFCFDQSVFDFRAPQYLVRLVDFPVGPLFLFFGCAYHRTQSF